MVAGVAAALLLAPAALAEPLAGLADCPDCDTDQGGGAVVDFYQQLNQGGSNGIQDPDPAGSNYMNQASGMLTDLEHEPVGTVAGEGGAASADAAQSTIGALARTFFGALEDYPPLLAVYGAAHLIGADPIDGWAELGGLIWHGVFGGSNSTPSSTFDGYYYYADQAYYTNSLFAMNQGTTQEGNPPGTAKWNQDPDCVAATQQGTSGLCTVLLFGNANGNIYSANWDEGSPGAPSGSNVRWWWSGKGSWEDSIDISNADLAAQSLVSVGAETPPPGVTPTQVQPATEPSRSQLSQNIDNALQNNATAQKWLEHELNFQDTNAAAAGLPGIRGIQNSFTGLYLGGIPGH